MMIQKKLLYLVTVLVIFSCVGIVQGNEVIDEYVGYLNNESRNILFKCEKAKMGKADGITDIVVEWSEYPQKILLPKKLDVGSFFLAVVIEKVARLIPGGDKLLSNKDVLSAVIEGLIASYYKRTPGYNMPKAKKIHKRVMIFSLAVIRSLLANVFVPRYLTHKPVNWVANKLGYEGDHKNLAMYSARVLYDMIIGYGIYRVTKKSGYCRIN